KPNELVIDELVQTKKLEPLPIENEIFEIVEFELVNNYLTHGNIIGTYVLVHYHDDISIEFNYVPNCNDQNNAFSENSINVYALNIYNLKNCVYSLPKGCYQLENPWLVPTPNACKMSSNQL
ncbi:unnamed protein product, partial [Sphagnum balticum]